MPDVLAPGADDVLSFTPGGGAFNPGIGAMGPVAEPAPPRPNLQPRIEESFAQADKEIQEARRIGQQQVENLKTRQAEVEPIRQRQLEQLRQPIPAAPEMQKPPPRPAKQNSHDDEQWLFAASILGALAGGLTRRHMTNALAAFSGAIEGYNQGSKQKFDENIKTWEMENKATQEANSSALADYKRVLDNKKLTLEQMSVEMQLAGQRHDDQAAVLAAQSKNAITMAQFYDKRAEASEKMQETSDRMSENRRQQELNRQARIDANNARVEAARVRQQSGALSDDSVDLRANMALEGNPQAYRGIRAGTPDLARITDRMAAIGKEQGLSAEEITRKQTQYTGEQSYQRTAGTMAARVEAAANEVVQLAPQAIAASDALPRGKWKPLNELFQDVEGALSDPLYNDLLLANFGLEKAYGRAMNPQGVPRVSEAEEAKARGILSTAVSQEAYRTQVRRLLFEVQASKRATAQTREGVKGEQGLSPESMGLKPPEPAGPVRKFVQGDNLEGIEDAVNVITDPFGMKGWIMQKLYGTDPLRPK
jgi:hypothetical protein